MDELTKDMLSEAIIEFLKAIIRIADARNYDRDSFVKASADMFAMMAEISTFESFSLKED